MKAALNLKSKLKLIGYSCFMLLMVFSFTSSSSNSSNQFLRTKEFSNAEKVLNWINAKQANAKTELHKNKYESLKNNININELWVEDIREGEKIILIPINNGFEIKHNKNKPVTNYLFLVMDVKGEIQLGEIVQYLSQDKTTKTPLPYNALHKLYTFEPVSGQFTNLSILNTDYYLHETEYRNGKNYKAAVLSPKLKHPYTPKNSNNIETICDSVNWYEHVSIFKPNGRLVQSETFLYSSKECFDSSDYRIIFEDQDKPFSRKTNMVWTVAEGKINGIKWRVLSEEEFIGLKSRDLKQKAIFSNVKHVRIRIDAPANFATWQEGTTEVKLRNDSILTAFVRGTIHFNSKDIKPKQVSNTKTWRSNKVWP